MVCLLETKTSMMDLKMKHWSSIHAMLNPHNNFKEEQFWQYPLSVVDLLDTSFPLNFTCDTLEQ